MRARERRSARPASCARVCTLRGWWPALLLLLLPSACTFDVASLPFEEGDSPALVPTTDPRRSLAVTEQLILERFSFQRVMDQLVQQSGVAGLSSIGLFQQWWDVLNPAPGLARGPHCDDVLDPQLGPVLNDFPYACLEQTRQAAQASCDPFASDSTCAYVPVGLFNRFDMMPASGVDCGEYKIVYAKTTGDRTFLSFEAVLPNPSPELGIEGCRPVVELWAGLSAIAFPEERANRLEQFYFVGLPAFPPALRLEHLGAAESGRGQVRTSFMAEADAYTASLREFKLKRSCGLQSCAWLRFAPATAKGNAYAPLFSALTQHTKRAGFQAYLPGQVRTLIGGTIAELLAEIPDAYNAGVSEGTDWNDATAYASQFGPQPSPLRNALDDALKDSRSALRADDVIARVQALTCVGCHGLSNQADLGGGLFWPESLGVNHVSESQTEPSDGTMRYLLSQALTTTFLPHRQALMEQFLARQLVPRPGAPSSRPIGGALVH